MAWENLNPIEITLRSSAAADSSAVLRRAAACRLAGYRQNGGNRVGSSAKFGRSSTYVGILHTKELSLGGN